MELLDFPMGDFISKFYRFEIKIKFLLKKKDIQELSIIIQSKHDPRSVKLIPDLQKISIMEKDAMKSFRDLQKFKA